jgi:uncharacterized protein YegL
MIDDMSLLNEELQGLHWAIRSDPVLDNAARLCVVTFSDMGKVVMPLARASASRIPELSVEGGTNYGGAFSELSRVIAMDTLILQRQGHEPLDPYCFFVVDGEPLDDDWLETFTKNMRAVHVGSQLWVHPVFTPIGIRDAPENVLKRLAYPPHEGRWYYARGGGVEQATAAIIQIIRTTIQDGNSPSSEPEHPAPALLTGRTPSEAQLSAGAIKPESHKGPAAGFTHVRLSEQLEIGVSLGGAGGYQVTARSSAGETPMTATRFPFSQEELDRRIRFAELAVTRTAAEFRRVPARDEEPARQLGADLFNFLFPSEVREHLTTMRAQAARIGLPLQVQLRIRSPELAALPWEFLYDPSRDDYLALSLPLTRHLEVPEPVRPLTVRGSLQILGMVSLPRALGNLDADQEKERVAQAMAALQRTGQVKLRWVAGQTWRDLRDALDDGGWHIVHFIGHGGFDEVSGEGFLALADERGHVHRLSASDLALLLVDSKSLGLVTLNSCDTARADAGDIFSSTAAVLMRRGVPAVVAMQYPMSDRVAITFSRGLYEAVARGIPVDQAVTRARRDIKLSHANSLEWATPVLHLRSEAANIFDVGTLQAEHSLADRRPTQDS